MSIIRLHADIESLIRRHYPRESGISLQYAVDCLFADRFNQPRPIPGIKRMAKSKVKPEEALSDSGKWKRKKREQEKREKTMYKDSITFTPGTYFIGDISYVIPRKDWLRIITADENAEGAHTVKKHPVWFHGTSDGDGTYYDQERRAYGVDTGTIGIAPVGICEKARLKHTLKNDAGQQIEFKEPFEVSYDAGTFFFGDIRIPTGPDAYDEDEDECSCR